MPPDVTGADGGSAASGEAAAWLEAWVAAAWRRWRTLGVLHALVCGLGVGLVLAAVIGSPAGRVAVVAAGLLGAVGALARRRFRDVRLLLAAVERQQPALRNALIAWHEAHATVPPALAARLAGQARAGLAATSGPRPHGRGAWLAAAACVATGLMTPAVISRWPAGATVGDARPGVTRAQRADAVASIDWTATVTPPAYARRPREVFRRPARLDVLAGSRIEVALVGWPAGGRVSLGLAALTPTARGAARVIALTAAASDVLLLRAAGGEMLASIALVVRPDAAPATRIVKPASDLRLDKAAGLVPIHITAHDDLGLRDVRLRFTKVSGSGESFTFVDGEWPVAITRASATQWTGSHIVDLAALGLAPGDSVVYHAVAHDARTGGEGAAESERFLIEITRPGARTGGEYSLPEPEERFALSQRMVIQLTERLLERRPRLSASAYQAEAQTLAMAQRRVRAEFVFMLGGEVEDEVAEAEHSHEVEAGRLDNRGQGELTEAVRQMAQAETRLTDAELREALPYEYRALAAVQAAFGKARYFMRTLPAPVQIDLSRRLQGDRARAASARWARAPLPDAQRAAALALLRRLESLDAGDAGPLAAVVPALVALDRGNAEWVAQVRALAETRHTQDLTRVLRQRLVAGAIGWRPIPLPSSAGEAMLPGDARHER